MADTDEAAPAERTPADVAAFWLDQIKQAQTGKVASWHVRGDKIIRRFKDEKDEGQGAMLPTQHRMNLLWSNVETMKPTLYARTPKPDIQRRNKDRDPVGRWASIVLERCVAYTLDAQDFDYTMRSVVSDYLLPGRGQVCEEYEPVFQRVEDGPDKVEWEKTRTRYIHWKDFVTNPARTWDEVWWGAYRTYETRAELIAFLERTGKPPEEARALVNGMVLDHQVADAPGSTEEDAAGEANKRATVWCVWSKRDMKVIYVSPGCEREPLAVLDPPVRLDGFFPFPRPMTTTTATDSVLPVPDFAMYQDQADEIDLMTQRINLLQKALKITGAYDSNSPALARMLNDANDNTLIPVDTWAYFAEKGGLKGQVDFMPLDMVVNALEKCIEAREVSKQNLYEITGISDIVRGASDAGETATAQQIKSQWGSLRIRDRQAEVQRFARDIIRIKAEIIAETFADDTLKRMSGVKLLTRAEKAQAQQLKRAAEAGNPQAQQIAQRVMAERPDMLELMQEPAWDDVVELLRNDRLRGFHIDIETDSTVNPDEMAERQAAVEFGTTIGGMLTAMAPILPQAPSLAPLFGEMLTFTARRFKIGETLETQIEQAMEALQKQLSQPKPDPEAEKVKAELQMKQESARLDAEVKTRTAMASAQLDERRAQADMAVKQQAAAMDGRIEGQRAEADIAIAWQKAAAEIDIAKVKAANDAAIARQAARDKPEARDGD